MQASAVIDAFERQTVLCSALGSVLYARLLEQAVIDLKEDGPIARLLGSWPGDPAADALPLRLLGAVHRMVLAGEAPALAEFYPSAGGQPVWPAVWLAFRELVATRAGEIRPYLAQPPQTNEVRRSAVLLGGFLTIARATELPLRLLEIGASAGLNLYWDRYHYTLGSAEWGDLGAPLRLAASWDGPPAPWQTPVTVQHRAGCDLAPFDLRDIKQVQLLEAYIWADQLDRLERLRAAIAAVRAAPPPLTRSAASAWLVEQLAHRPAGAGTVVYHSVVWPYMGEEEQQAVTELLDEAGRRSTADAPLAWLRLEAPPSSTTGLLDLRLTLWPAGAETLLARATPHGQEITWLAAG